MALTKAIEFKGIPVAAAYVRVSSLTILSGNSRMEFYVSYLSGPDSVAFDGRFDSCGYDIEGNDPINQAYIYLKTLADFEGFTDC